MSDMRCNRFAGRTRNAATRDELNFNFPVVFFFLFELSTCVWRVSRTRTQLNHITILYNVDQVWLADMYIAQFTRDRLSVCRRHCFTPDCRKGTNFQCTPR